MSTPAAGPGSARFAAEVEPSPGRDPDDRPAGTSAEEPADVRAPSTEQPAVGAAPDEAATARGEIENAAATLEGKLQRALADIENLRKRYDRELAREQQAERMRVTAQWLPVVDDLERALEHASSDPDAVMTGIRAVVEQALGVLERAGFPRFEDVGEHFDPARHEALATAEASAPAGTVVAVARPGYGKNDVILRPAGVVVARGSC